MGILQFSLLTVSVNTCSYFTGLLMVKSRRARESVHLYFVLSLLFVCVCKFLFYTFSALFIKKFIMMVILLITNSILSSVFVTSKRVLYNGNVFYI